VEDIERMRSATIVRLFDQGTHIQLLCSDERGLLSVYLELKTFQALYKKINKAGINLAGLLIRFNRYLMNVPALGNASTLFPLRVK